MGRLNLSTFNAFKNCDRKLEGDLNLLTGNTLDLLTLTALNQSPAEQFTPPMLAEQFEALHGDSTAWRPSERVIGNSLRRLSDRFITVENFSNDNIQVVSGETPDLTRGAALAGVLCGWWQKHRLASPQILFGASSKSPLAPARFATLRVLNLAEGPLKSNDIGHALRESAGRVRVIVNEFEQERIVAVEQGAHPGKPKIVDLTENFRAPARELMTNIVALSLPEGKDYGVQLGKTVLADGLGFSALMNFSEPHFSQG